jgi:hypothetical protein
MGYASIVPRLPIGNLRLVLANVHSTELQVPVGLEQALQVPLPLLFVANRQRKARCETSVGVATATI